MGTFKYSGGVEIIGFISPTDPNDQYPVIDPLYGIDGFRNVNTLSDLNNIPNLRRRAGMVVGVSGGTTYYKLNPSPWLGNISDWSLFQTGGGGSVSGEYLPLSGGTVTGNTIFTLGLTSNTISATTYQNLPVSGLTAGNNINVSGSSGNFTISFTGLTQDYLPLSGGTVSGDTKFTSGLTANTISASTYYNYPTFTGGTVSGGTNFISGLTANTLTVNGVKITGDTYTTGGTYNNNGSINFNYNNGTGFTVTGLYTGQTSYVNSISVGTGLSANTTTGIVTIINTEPDKQVTITGGTNIEILGSYPNFGVNFTGNTSGNYLPLSGGTVSGATSFTSGITANTISATTYSNLPTDIRVTGATYSNNTFTYTNNTGGTFNVLFNTVTGLTSTGTISANTISTSSLSATTLTVNGVNITGDTFVTGGTYSAGTITFRNNQNTTFPVTGLTQPFTGGTVSGATNFTSGLTATTISATTYQNLPTDVRVTGGTYSGGTTIFTNNTGGTFSVSGFSTANTFTGGTVSGTTNFTNGLTANTISATTYQNLPVSGLTAGSNINLSGSSGNFTISVTGITGGSTFTGGTVSGATNFTNGLTANTISATTYQNLPSGVWGISNSGGTYTFYSTLSLAMSAATSGQVIEMFADVTNTTGTPVTLKPNITIQGNGHTYLHTNTTGDTFTLTTTGTYRFMNMVIKRTVTTPTGAFIFNNVGASFYQNYSMVFQNTSIEYTWTTSTGATPFVAPSTNVCYYYIDGIRALANGSGTMFGGNVSYIQTIKNSVIENTGTGSCFSSDNITGGSYIENSHLKTNSGTVITFSYAGQGDAIRNSTVISTSGIGVSGGYAYNTSSFSSTNRSFSGVICYNCAGSTASGTVFYQSSAYNTTGVSATGYVVVPFFTLSSFYNCSFNAVGNIVAYDTSYSAAFYNCVLSTSYNNSAGHAISLAGSGNVLVNCYVTVANTSANCFRGTSAISAKYSNNVFAGATTPVNSNVTQSIVNTQDNQGNILI